MSLSLFCSGTTGGLSLPFHMFLHVPCTGSCLQPGSRTQYQISVTRSSLRVIQVALRHQRAFPLLHPFPEVSLYLVPVPVPGRGRSTQKYWRPQLLGRRYSRSLLLLCASVLLQFAAAVRASVLLLVATPVCATPGRSCAPVVCFSSPSSLLRLSLSLPPQSLLEETGQHTPYKSQQLIRVSSS